MRLGNFPEKSLFVLLASLALTLFSVPWLAIPGWGLLIALMRNQGTTVIINAAFFFAAFFHPLGLSWDLGFTLKHYHLVILIGVILHTVQRKILPILKEGLLYVRGLWPMAALLMISVGAGLWHQTSSKTLFRAANLSLVLMSLVYLAGIVGKNEKLLERGLIFYIGGIAVQVFVNVYNLTSHRFIFELDLMYNNQFGVLTAGGLLYAVGLTLSLRGRDFNPAEIGLMALVIFLGLILTCSRSSWISFIVGFFLFLTLTGFYLRNTETKKTALKRGLLMVFSLLGCLLLAALIEVDVLERLKRLGQIFDIGYWNYLFEDKNYGFFGLLRMRQIQSLGRLLEQHPWWGIGFAPQVTDLHGLYFTLLGASGITGFYLFLIFIVSLLKKLLGTILQHPNSETSVLRITTFCAVMIWLASSVTQTMFLHFSVWIPVLASFLHIAAARHPKEPA